MKETAEKLKKGTVINDIKKQDGNKTIVGLGLEKKQIPIK